MGCPGASAIAVFVGGPRGDQAATGAVERHLAECAACRRLVGVLAQSSTATADEREPPRLVAAGATIGRYQVRDVLGAGAMGVVYAARDPELDRDVAIKVLHPGLAGRLDLLAEAQAMARIRHPNVVAVHDAGTDGDRLYVAMELVSGTDLRAWLAEPRPWRELVRVMIGAGRGLAAAHALGLVHRDFKPANVLLGAVGQVCVTDFGLACAAGARTDIAGTPAYMAPEHLAGAAPAASADQYSFGRVLAEALARSGDRVPPRLLAIARRAAAADPAARFASMTAVLDALDRRGGGRRRPVAVAIGAAVLVTALGAVAAGVGGRDDAAAGDPCRDAGDAARAGVAIPDAAAIRAALATGDPAVVDRAAARVAGWHGRWSAMRVHACRANRVLGAESDELFDLRIACLDARARDLAAVVDQLGVAPAPTERAADALEQATELDACADGKALLAPLRLPADPAARAAVLAMRGALATALAMHRLGREAAAVALAEQVADTATRAGAGIVLAEALHLAARGRVSLASDTLATNAAWTEASSAIERALIAAEAAGHDRVRADLYLTRAGIHLTYDEVDAAAHDRDLARALISRLGDTGLTIQLAMEDGWTALELDDVATGIPLLEAAAAARIARDGGPVAMTGEVWTRIGVAYLDAGEPARARPYLERALGVLERVLGTAHPGLVRTLIGLGDAAAADGDHRDAIAVLQRAAAIAEASGAVPEEVGAQLAFSLAAALAPVGERAAAIAQLDRAAAVYGPAVRGADAPAIRGALNYAQIAALRGTIRAEAGDAGGLADLDDALAVLTRAGAPTSVLAATLVDRGTACRRLGRLGAARAAYQRALGLDPSARFAAELGLGLVELARGALARARGLLERALAAAADDADATDDADGRAAAQLGLARALRATGDPADRARAAALAADARVIFAATDADEAVAAVTEIDRWAREP